MQIGGYTSRDASSGPSTSARNQWDEGGRGTVVRVPRTPVLSDALQPPDGPIQGLAWFFDSFKRDEWGSVAHELLEAVQGQLMKARSKKVGVRHLVFDRPPKPLNVRLRRPQHAAV